MKSFSELNLDPSIQRALQEMGIETPSPIQAQALPILLGQETDFIGLAATGTGKTAAFTLPLLQRLDPGARGVQAIILCPTRELAVQVAGQIDLMGKYLGVKALPIYGGASYDDQIRGLRRGATIVVGTPGRVVDHLERGTLQLEEVHTVILDEADEMISMGFKEDLEAVLGSIPEGQAAKWLFSATMSREVRKVADEYLVEPKQVQVNRTETIPELVEQVYYATSEANKPEVLCKLIDVAESFYGIIFCQTKALVMELNQYLKSRGYGVDCLHGDMDQKARERVMNAFRDRKITVLVATDVACRGLDVKDLTHVINYSIPRELDHYVHRIGRTGRSGKPGLAISLVTPSHRGLIPRVERITQRRMKEGKIPTRKEIAVRKVASQLALLQAQTQHERAVELLDDSWKTALEGMTKEEIVGRFLAILNPQAFSEQREKPEVSVTPEAPRGSRRQGGYVPRPAGEPARTIEMPRRRDDERPSFKPSFKKSFEGKPAKKTFEKKPFGKSEKKGFSKPYKGKRPNSIPKEFSWGGESYSE
jgi:ATP-dependent RNA helicase DeaD